MISDSFHLPASVTEDPWLWFLDSDVIIQPDTLARLLALDTDIATGLIRSTRNLQLLECGRTKAVASDALPRSDHPDFVSIQPAPDVLAAGEPFGVDHCGAGCMLVHRCVFEALEPPWFVANVRSLVGQNSDWNFTLRAAENDFAITVDPHCRLTQLTVTGIIP